MTVLGLKELLSGKELVAKSSGDEIYDLHPSLLDKNKKVDSATTVLGQGELRFRMFAANIRKRNSP